MMKELRCSFRNQISSLIIWLLESLMQPTSTSESPFELSDQVFFFKKEKNHTRLIGAAAGLCKLVDKIRGMSTESVEKERMLFGKQLSDSGGQQHFPT